MPDRQPLQYRVHGMDCVEEVTLLKRELAPIVGEENLDFDLLNAKLTVRGDAPEEEIETALKRTGLKAEPWRDEALEEEKSPPWRDLRTVLTAASGILTAAGGALHFTLAGWGGEELPLIVILTYLGAILSGVWLVLPKAVSAARRLRPDMNLLMIIAVGGAIGIGEWLEAAMVSFLFALSLLLEAWSVGRARRAVRSLLDLAPAKARKKCGSGCAEMVPVESVATGSIIEVRPGERIPLDGVVDNGSSAVDQSPVTGESIPVEKEPGDEVFAGTINSGGVLEIRTTREAADSTIAQIIRLVSDAQSKRAPVEQRVEVFARYYTPAVLILAVVIALVPPVLFGGSWGYWFYNALVLLVIACPCALVISTPVSIVAGLTSAARRGVLVKGGIYLELPARIRSFAFDKTGTLTHGRPEVMGVHPFHGHDEEEVLTRGQSLGKRSNHPLSQAIEARARQAGISAESAGNNREIPGRGVEGTFDDRPFWLGSMKFAEEKMPGGQNGDYQQVVHSIRSEGHSVVAVGSEEHVCGVFAVGDTLRDETRLAMEELRAAGAEHLIMLTGDNEEAARAIAGRAGIDDVRAGLMPEEKVAAVEELLEKYGRVAMVGDGVNDAPALARGTLGIAMGAAGTDAALETADIALMGDDLRLLPWLVHHSRRTLNIIHQNIGVSLAIKFLFVVLTLLGLASLWGAIAADTGVSLLVIMNALRLLRE